MEAARTSSIRLHQSLSERTWPGARFEIWHSCSYGLSLSPQQKQQKEFNGLQPNGLPAKKHIQKHVLFFFASSHLLSLSKFPQVDINGDRIGLTKPVDVGIQGDAGSSTAVCNRNVSHGFASQCFTQGLGNSRSLVLVRPNQNKFFWVCFNGFADDLEKRVWTGELSDDLFTHTHTKKRKWFTCARVWKGWG